MSVSLLLVRLIAKGGFLEAHWIALSASQHVPKGGEGCFGQSFTDSVFVRGIMDLARRPNPRFTHLQAIKTVDVMVIELVWDTM